LKLRQFVSVLGVVALVAVIYSPSSIGFSASPGGDGGTGPFDTSASGTSMFLSYLHQAGYPVVVANDTGEVMTYLLGQQRIVYVLVGPDYQATQLEVSAVRGGFAAGRVSALIAEGNTTNDDLLGVFGAQSTGASITDPTSTFQDRRVFTVEMALGSATEVGVIDIASPIVLLGSSTLQPVAQTSALSVDAQSDALGPRAVVAAGPSSTGARAVVVSDSGPFTNFLFNYTQGGVDEKAFVSAMVSYVDPGKGATVVVDNSEYAPAKPPKVQAGLPIGPLVAYGMEQSLSSLNGFYSSFPSQISQFFQGFGVDVSPGAATAVVALILLLSVYAAITRWFAPEKRGNDDQPVPGVERKIVAQSRERAEFLQTARSKSGYVRALAQLYEVLDSIVVGEFGAGMASVGEAALASRVGADEARRAKRLFLNLSRLHEYAIGERRFLLPPVLRWRALASRTTKEAEAFLNTLGITIGGGESARKMEYLVKERVRA